MASSAAVPTPSDAILNVYIPHPPSSPFARRLAALGEQKMAERAEYCGRRAKRKCAEGHVTTIVQHCSGSGCWRCLPKILEKIYRRWEKTVELLSKDPNRRYHKEKIHFIEARVPRECTKEAAEEEFSKITRNLPHKIHWERFVGYQNGYLIFRLIVLGVAPANWGETIGWSGGTLVTVTPGWLFQLPWYFEKRLLQPWLPKGDTERAEQQAIFKSFHRFRFKGVRTEKEISTSKSTLDAEMSDEDDAPAAPGQTFCKVCGGPHVLQSQWLAADEPNPIPELWRWYGIG